MLRTKLWQTAAVKLAKQRRDSDRAYKEAELALSEEIRVASLWLTEFLESDEGRAGLALLEATGRRIIFAPAECTYIRDLHEFALTFAGYVAHRNGRDEGDEPANLENLVRKFRDLRKMGKRGRPGIVALDLMGTLKAFVYDSLDNIARGAP